MPPFPDTQVEPLVEHPKRWVIWAEDASILICLALLWLPITGQTGPLVNAIMVASLVAMTALLLRRKRRVDRLFEAMRRQQEQLEQSGGFPLMPGMMPPPHAGTRPRQSASVNESDD